MEVDYHRVGRGTFEDRVDRVEGGAGDFQPDPATEVDHRDPHSARLDHGVAAAWVGARVVGRADNPLGAFEVGVGGAVAIDVVAGGDDSGAGVEDVVGGPLGDPHPARRVLAVDDDQVWRMELA